MDKIRAHEISIRRWIERLMADPATQTPAVARSMAIKLALMTSADQEYSWISAEALAPLIGYSASATEKGIPILKTWKNNIHVEPRKKRPGAKRKPSNIYYPVFSEAEKNIRTAGGLVSSCTVRGSEVALCGGGIPYGIEHSAFGRLRCRFGALASCRIFRPRV